MANNKMLIDASHPEETRVAVVRGNRVEEFDFESQAKKQLRGNIYLAKVTRVEPSLQAAFVDYGGNRHGFLAFSEIHPDYYQIPMADRQALLEEEAREADEEAEEEENERSGRRRRPRRGDKNRNRGTRANGEESEDASASDDDDEAGDLDGHDNAVMSGETSDDGDTSEDEAAEESTDDDDGDQDGRPGSMAAMIETDSISEPAPEPEGGAEDSDGEAEPAAEEKPKRKRKAPAKPRKTKKQLAEEAAAAEAVAAEEAAAAETGDGGTGGDGDTEAASTDDGEAVAVGADGEDSEEPARERRNSRPNRNRRSGRSGGAAGSSAADGSEDYDSRQTVARSDDDGDDEPTETGSGSRGEGGDGGSGGEGASTTDEDEQVESVGQEDALEEVPYRRKLRRQYKIQEVIKRRQIMLVQVVKEERGNKGAALTTYLSLAGRYSVLMPNTARGGGISRKITNSADRKRLKEIAGELEVPQGMGVILRTAGASRTKPEVKRDFEYLMRLWENVRNLTLSSSAPCLVYEEGSLIKRSIRDLYDKDTGEIIVAGEEGYREAKDFMRMLMPSHARHVKHYSEPQAIFSRFGVEQQLDRLLLPQVTLRSGGYIVINQTEALVSIDVNSGRSTREHSIEDTAVQTNLEAADEVARQLRLRDLAGLIVIDFIDMEENRNNRAVEKRLKEALKNDRARIQVGRISHFGLMEMSRQRIRASVMESTMEVCPHCQGLGHVRSHSSIALHVFRAIEEHLTRNPRHDVIARCPFEIALDILNHKRASLIDLEDRFGVTITVQGDPALPGQSFHIERGEPATRTPRKVAHVVQGEPEDEEDEDLEAYADEMAEASDEAGESETRQSRDNDEDRGGRKKRRRRRRGGRRDGPEAENRDAAPGDEEDGETDSSDAGEAIEADAESESGNGGEERGKRKRRRGKRGGRKNRSDEAVGVADGEGAEDSDGDEEGEIADGSEEATSVDMEERETVEEVAAETASEAEDDKDVSTTDEAAVEYDGAEEVTNPRRRNTRRPKVQSVTATAQEAETETVAQSANEDAASVAEEAPAKPKKGGWWSRGGGFF